MIFMIGNLLKKIVGSRNERELKRLQVYVDRINQLEPEMQILSNDDIRAKTGEFKQRLNNVLSALSSDISPLDQRAAVENALNDLLPEAFAVVREVSKRTLNMRHFDVQLIGGIALHEGKISEMKTGEGKTLTTTLPLYLNALSGKSAHLVTVNDYLARRDAEWMGPIFTSLGLEVACLQNWMGDAERKKAYAADILYATNNELGFDYL